MGADHDPLLFGRLKVFWSWYELLPCVLRSSERPVQLAWKKAWNHLLNVKRRWSHVRGPLAAVIACLQDINWDAPEPWLWIDRSDGATFDLRTCDPERLF
eukprot:2688462-Pyramimonas_sp.AAC.1